ncbi:hypothetical protein [Snodgrassella sp. CFCC 13594]|nr:hypothetical protein [Snodgrassella sp. CFCC 13594]
MNKILMLLTVCALAACATKAPTPHGPAFPINQSQLKDVAK